MRKYKLTLVKNGNQSRNITPMVGNLQWSESIENLGIELSCDCMRNIEDKFMKNYDIVELGDSVILTSDDREIFRGIIVSLDIEKYIKKISALDYAFYLNQSSVVKQYNGISASSAIRRLCNEFNVPIGKIVDIPVSIKKIYNKETVSEVIKDIIKTCEDRMGVKYRMEMKEGKFFLIRYEDLIIETRYRPTPFYSVNPMEVLENVTHSLSFADMKNSVIVSSGNEESVQTVASVKDDKNISKYGLLQIVEDVSEEDLANARNIARNKLAELNKVTEDLKITTLGDDRVRAGRLLKINNDAANLKGLYLVKDCSHEFQNTILKMSLTLQKVG